jgi:hypothetical protein
MPENLRKATDEERCLVREELAQAVIRKATAFEIDEIRRKLAAQLGLTYPQIKAIGAWKKDSSGQLILKPTDVSDNSKSDSNTVDDFSATSDEIIMPADSIVEIENEFGEIETGEIDPYDNPEKRDWRMAIRTFAAKYLKRKPAVACLPAANWHEVHEIYDPLKINRSDIYGAEANPELQPTFERKAEDLGTQHYSGTFQKLMRSNTTRYGFVNLDFRGQMCKQSFNVLNDVLLDDVAVVVVNFMRKRERREIQNVLKGTAFALKNYPVNTVGIDETYDRYYQLLRDEGKNEMPLDEAMDIAASQVLSGKIGENRREKWMMADKIDKIVELAHTEKFKLAKNGDLEGEPTLHILFAMWAAIADMEKAIDEQTTYGLSHFHNTSAYLPNLVTDALFQKPKLIEFEEYYYVSPTGNAPFLTHMYLMQTPRYEYLQLSNTVRFFLDVAERFYACKKAGEEVGGIKLEDIQGKLLTKKTPKNSGDRFVYRDGKGQKIATLKIQTLIDDDHLYTKIYNSTVLSKRGIRTNEDSSSG